MSFVGGVRIAVSKKMSKLRQVLCVWSRLLLDVVAIAVLCALELGVYLAEKNGLVAERRGFFCDDTSIRLPFKESTVPSWLLTLSAVSIPLIAVSSINNSHDSLKAINLGIFSFLVSHTDNCWKLHRTFHH